MGKNRTEFAESMVRHFTELLRRDKLGQNYPALSKAGIKLARAKLHMWKEGLKT